MAEQAYEIVQNGTGWVLRRHRTALVEFATQDQAVRAGVAVCRDEGLASLRILRADGGIEVVDPLMLDLEA